MKNILAIIIALVASYFFMSFLFWVITHSFMLMWTLWKLAMTVAIALPLYIVIRKKLLS